MTVINGREHSISLASHGFELVQCPKTLTTADFYEKDQKKIKDIYFEEIKEFVKRSLGAEHAAIFHHQLRNEERKNAGVNNLFGQVQGNFEVS